MYNDMGGRVRGGTGVGQTPAAGEGVGRAGFGPNAGG